MNKTLSLLALALFLALPGCRSGVDPSASQRYLFEVSRLKYMRYDHSGFSIDVDGNLYSFQWQPQMETSGFYQKDEHTADELAAHYAPNRKFVRTIPHDSLEMMKGLIASVGEKNSDTVGMAPDGGTDMAFYRYDADRKVYSRVVLGRSGDLNFVNTSTSGKTIAEWLLSIELELTQ